MNFLKGILKIGKKPITVTDYEEAVFEIFSSRQGQLILNSFIHGEFSDSAHLSPTSLTSESLPILAFQEGRRSVIREFIKTVDKVHQQSITGKHL